MRVQALPKSWLIHTVTYEKYLGLDDYSSPSFAEPITIYFVRYDQGSLFSRGSFEETITATGVIFVDYLHSTPAVEWKERSRITFDGSTLIVTAVVTTFQPRSNEVHHFEIEVV